MAGNTGSEAVWKYLTIIPHDKLWVVCQDIVLEIVFN